MRYTEMTPLYRKLCFSLNIFLVILMFFILKLFYSCVFKISCIALQKKNEIASHRIEHNMERDMQFFSF